MSKIQSWGVMSHSIKQLFSLPVLLLLLLWKAHIQAEQIIGTAGKRVKIAFTFQNLPGSDIRNLNLNKDSVKVAECIDVKTLCTHGRYVFERDSQAVSLTITDLTSSDAGTYYISLIPKTLTPIESVKVSLVITPREPSTVTPSTSPNTGYLFNKPLSSGPSVYICIFAAFGVVSVVLLTVLLAWFYLTRESHSDHQRPHGPSCKSKVAGEASTSMPVYSIEYVMLDFHKRPGGREKDGMCDVGLKPRDDVEYATITFHPGQTEMRRTEGQLC